MRRMGFVNLTGCGIRVPQGIGTFQWDTRRCFRTWHRRAPLRNLASDVGDGSPGRAEPQVVSSSVGRQRRPPSQFGGWLQFVKDLGFLLSVSFLLCFFDFYAGLVWWTVGSFCLAVGLFRPTFVDGVRGRTRVLRNLIFLKMRRFAIYTSRTLRARLRRYLDERETDSA